MKQIVSILIILTLLSLLRCGKEEETSRFDLLTAVTWSSDSLLVNGADAGGPGQLLYKFRGDAKFNKDGTGTFGKFNGTWWFTESQTQIVISSDSLAMPLTTVIGELSEQSLKINTQVPDLTNFNNVLKIRMTFKAK